MRSLSPINATRKRWARTRKGPPRGGPIVNALRAPQRPFFHAGSAAARQRARVLVWRALSNTGRKNLSTYKRRRLFHVITHSRAVNDFFESPAGRPDAYYESLLRVSRSLLLDFTAGIGIDPPASCCSLEIEAETRRPVTNPVPRRNSHLRVVIVS